MPSQPLVPSGRVVRLALIALALGSFALATGEFVTMGLLPQIAVGVHVSLPRCGHLISAYALGVVVGAPLIAGVGARAPRRALLIGLMILFVGGNVVSAFAPSYTLLLAARFIAGLPHGAYIGVSVLTAASLVEHQRRAWAIARAMLGLSIANVIGVPLAVWLGQWLGWRAAFVAVAVLAAVTAIGILHVVPRVSASSSATLRSELGAFRRPQVLLTLAVGAIGFGGLFSVYTYISPTLTNRAGIGLAEVPLVLVVWGLGMVAGNMVGGRVVEHGVMRSLFVILAATVLFLAFFALGSARPLTATVGAFLVGATFALVPALQTRLMDVAADAQTLAAALNHSALNGANALGAWFAGIAIAAGGGWAAPAWVGVGLALSAMVMLAVSAVLEQRGPTELLGELSTMS